MSSPQPELGVVMLQQALTSLLLFLLENAKQAVLGLPGVDGSEAVTYRPGRLLPV